MRLRDASYVPVTMSRATPGPRHDPNCLRTSLKASPVTAAFQEAGSAHGLLPHEAIGAIMRGRH